MDHSPVGAPTVSIDVIGISSNGAWGAGTVDVSMLKAN
jgi:hypothetical protein